MLHPEEIPVNELCRWNGTNGSRVYVFACGKFYQIQVGGPENYKTLFMAKCIVCCATSGGPDILFRLL